MERSLKEIFKENINRQFAISNKKQKDLADFLEVSEQSVSNYINGVNIPRMGKIELICEFFGIKRSDLLEEFVPKNVAVFDTNQGIVGDNTGTVNITNNNTDTSEVEQAQAVALVTQKEILDVQTLSGGAVTEMLEVQKEILSYQKKIYDFLTNKPTPDNTISEELYEYNVIHRLSAGTGSDIPMDYLDYDVVYHDKKIDYDLASYITGDSMEPTYFDGEIALIKKTGFDYDGGVYAVVWDGQTYIKKVYREDDGLRLVSLNNKYRDKFAPFEEEPVVIGLVVGHFVPEGR